MSQIELNNDKMDILNAKKSMDFFNLTKVASAVRKEEMVQWMDKVKRCYEMVSVFIHRVVCDKVYELERDEKNGRMD